MPLFTLLQAGVVGLFTTFVLQTLLGFLPHHAKEVKKY